MKVTVLIENTTPRSDLVAEHGLSLYIETAAHTILFDTGQTGAFADNAAKLGVDLQKVDFCVLSHGHYDHGGGLARFLEVNDHAPVYLGQDGFEPHFSSGRFIGLDAALEGNPRLIPVPDRLALADGIPLLSCNELARPFPFDVFGQSVRRNHADFPEDYRHEQYLLLEEGGKTFCFSGCSHKGVRNILHWLRPDVFFGGFHFIKLDPAGRELSEAARHLAAFPTRYYTGHCTGQSQFGVLQQALGDRLADLTTRTVITL